ncbi:protein phosphatase 2C domain-containing protein [Actinomadura barringtoniae]|uniref:Protein phosphatase 2C domain-containing protein n=1 Tax=Actinomadura barringtoniae TaxID=1427535 RepID=A0A939PSZ0_9ACTN|nr:PP2C family serine/threonine-protein phosphatase [Actinomadura barringtoniae]MBO2455684.1 protein phosphatase 2C domain-containing protein [Actinomadura barringtoniae]
MAEAATKPCPNCGEGVFEGEDFCEACGHALSEKAVAARAHAIARADASGMSRPVTRRTDPVKPKRPCTGCGATSIDADGYCEECGLRQPADRDHIEIELPERVAAGASDRGKRYPRNEDALALSTHPSGVAAVVCDGVGSSPRPDEASLAAAQTGVAELLAGLEAGADPETATHKAVLKAAEAVAALAESPHEAPSCTYVSAVTTPGSITIGWVGDSRAYWLANGANEASAQLSVDDSWAAFMVAEGALTEAEAEAHPNAHVITAWLGADADEVRPSVATFTPSGPGTVVVCSDGLWNYAGAPADLTAVLAAASSDPAADPLGAARTLVQHALDSGGRDNISVALIPVTPNMESPS